MKNKIQPFKRSYMIVLFLLLAYTGNASTTLNLTCFIEAYWNGVNAMRPVLANQGQTAPANACDYIHVELHDANNIVVVLYETDAILNQNGTATCIFNTTVAVGNYYIVVNHRSAVQTWSTNPEAFGTGSTSYNFSDASNKAYGDNMVEVSPGVWAFYSGELNQDGNIDLLDQAPVENDVYSFKSGFFATDINGDGNVDIMDLTPFIETNIANFIFIYYPPF